MSFSRISIRFSARSCSIKACRKFTIEICRSCAAQWQIFSARVPWRWYVSNLNIKLPGSHSEAIKFQPDYLKHIQDSVSLFPSAQKKILKKEFKINVTL